MSDVIDGLSAEESVQFRQMQEVDDVPARPEKVQREPKERPAPVEASDDSVADPVEPDHDDDEAEDTEAPAPKADKVAYGRFEKERKRRQELERQNAELQAFHAAVQAKFQASQQAPQEPAPKPRLNEDPAAFIETLDQRLDRMEHFNQKRAQAEAEHHQAQQVRAQLDQRFEADVADLVGDVPDLQDAFNYLGEHRRKELTLAGYSGAQIQQIMDADYYNTVHSHAQRGASPAKFFYEAAKLRGYRQKAANGADTGLERIQQGQTAAKSLSSAGGSPTRTGRLTAKDVGEMSQAEFNKRLAADPDFFRKIAGGGAAPTF